MTDYPPPVGPATERDYETINKHLREIEMRHGEVQTALKAGFDCAPEDELCQKVKARLQQIKAAYFPNRP